MKITKSLLRKIIKEEVNRVLLEADLTTPEGRANMLAGFLNSKGVKTATFQSQRSEKNCLGGIEPLFIK